MHNNKFLLNKHLKFKFWQNSTKSRNCFHFNFFIGKTFYFIYRLVLDVQAHVVNDKYHYKCSKQFAIFGKHLFFSSVVKIILMRKWWTTFQTVDAQTMYNPKIERYATVLQKLMSKLTMRKRQPTMYIKLHMVNEVFSATVIIWNPDDHSDLEGTNVYV